MSDQLNKVIEYYDSTNFEYQNFWSRQSLAMHFGYYDSNVKTHQASLQRMNQVLAGLANIQSSDRVFDAGCGYGGSAIWLAEHTGCNVVGSTIVPYQVKRAQKQAKKSSARSKLEFTEGDYSNTGLENESFTVIWGLESIVHCEDKRTFLREAYRLLKPGGRLLISEYMLRDNPPLKDADYSLIKDWLKAWAMPNLLTPTQYKQFLKQAGFQGIQTHDLSENVEPSLLVCRTYARRALRVVGVLQKLSVINHVSTDNTVANYKLHELFKKGLWQYKVIIATKPK